MMDGDSTAYMCCQWRADLKTCQGSGGPHWERLSGKGMESVCLLSGLALTLPGLGLPTFEAALIHIFMDSQVRRDNYDGL